MQLITWFVKVTKTDLQKLIFKQLLYKLTIDCTIQFNQSFYKKIDGCVMGGPLSIILAIIHTHGKNWEWSSKTNKPCIL